MNEETKKNIDRGLNLALIITIAFFTSVLWSIFGHPAVSGEIESETWVVSSKDLNTSVYYYYYPKSHSLVPIYLNRTNETKTIKLEKTEYENRRI